MPNAKIVVGRSFEDNQNIERFAGDNIIVSLADYPGPLAAVSMSASYDEVMLAGSIIAGYAKVPDDTEVKMYIKLIDKVLNDDIISIKPEEIKYKMIRSKI